MSALTKPGRARQATHFLGYMNPLIAKLRLNWLMLTGTFKYTSGFLDRLYKIYMNHNKIIHFRRGHPVYSLSSPALYSKPQINFFAQQFYKTINGKNVPNLMSFAVTDKCNASCQHCSFFSGFQNDRPVLDLNQAKEVIRQAQELGTSVINFVGGEPLLREDFPEIIRSVNKDLSTTIMFTNGLLLCERMKELKEAGLDSIYVSVDASNPDVHDKFRGKEGIFDKAVKGIEKAISKGLSVGISCCMTPEAFERGEFADIAELGKRIGVHEILIFGAVPTGRYKDRSDLIGNTGWIEEMINQAEAYSRDYNYPGVAVYPYGSSHRSIGCSGGTCYMYVSPYGDVCPCDFNHVSFGNISQEPLYKIWDRMTSNDDFKRVKWGGCKLRDPDWHDKATVSGVFCVYQDVGDRR